MNVRVIVKLIHPDETSCFVSINPHINVFKGFTSDIWFCEIKVKQQSQLTVNYYY